MITLDHQQSKVEDNQKQARHPVLFLQFAAVCFQSKNWKKM